MSLIEKIVRLRRWRLAREVLLFYGVELPAEVEIGRDFNLVHRGVGTVVHPSTTIGDRVRIYHQVTIGRLDAHLPASESDMERIVIEDDVVLFPGAKVLGGAGITYVRRGTILGANAVLTRSTGRNEIWAGVPAKMISIRTDLE